VFQPYSWHDIVLSATIETVSEDYGYSQFAPFGAAIAVVPLVSDWLRAEERKNLTRLLIIGISESIL